MIPLCNSVSYFKPSYIRANVDLADHRPRTNDQKGDCLSRSLSLSKGGRNIGISEEAVLRADQESSISVPKSYTVKWKSYVTVQGNSAPMCLLW